MLSHISIKNFRSLRDVSVDLRPLTVLVGPNDSGKSSFLSALQRLSSGTILFPYDLWRQDATKTVRIDGITPAGACVLDSSRQQRRGGFQPSPAQSGVIYTLRDESEREAFNFVEPYYQIQLPTQGIAAISDGYNDDLGLQPLGADGMGLPALLDYLLRRERSRFDAILGTMREFIKGLQDIEIRTPTPVSRRIDFVIENGLRITADQASAGVRLLLFFVTLAHHPSPPKLILLEEPESGVHPMRLREIVAFLRDLAHGNYGSSPAQIIMTTHSPYLLDAVDLETDQVLVFRREEDGSRNAEAADADRLRTFLDEFLLGEVWFNQGEEGLVSRRS